MLYITNSTAVPFHFNSKKFLALSIVNCGSGCGSVVAPYSVVVLLKESGYRNCCLVLALLPFLTCLTSAFYFPVPSQQPDILHTQENMHDEDVDSNNVRSGRTSNEEQKEISSKQHSLPIASICHEFSKTEHGHVLSHVTGGENNSITDYTLGPVYNDLFPLSNITIKKDVLVEKGMDNQHGKDHKESNQKYQNHKTETLPSDKGVQVNELKTKKKMVYRCQSLKLLKNPIFLAIALALVGNSIAISVNKFKVALILEKGYTIETAAQLAIISSAAELVLGPVMGILFCMSSVRPFVKYIYAAAFMLSGFSLAMFGVMKPLAVLITMSVLRGVVKSSINGHLSGIMAELFGVEEMLVYTAAARVFQGITFSITFYVAGQ